MFHLYRDKFISLLHLPSYSPSIGIEKDGKKAVQQTPRGIKASRSPTSPHKDTLNKKVVSCHADCQNDGHLNDQDIVFNCILIAIMEITEKGITL